MYPYIVYMIGYKHIPVISILFAGPEGMLVTGMQCIFLSVLQTLTDPTKARNIFELSKKGKRYASKQAQEEPSDKDKTWVPRAGTRGTKRKFGDSGNAVFSPEVKGVQKELQKKGGKKMRKKKEVTKALPRQPPDDVSETAANEEK